MVMHSQKRPVLSFLLHIRNRYLLLCDLLTLPFVVYLAFVLRLETFVPQRYILTLAVMVVATLGIKPAILALFGGYARYWPFASLSELRLIFRAAIVGELVVTLFIFTLAPFFAVPEPPRSIPIISFLLTLAAFAAPRLGLRWLYHSLNARHNHQQNARRVLIIGAGESGCLVLQEIQRNPKLLLFPMGFVDDDPHKQRLNIHGIEVLGYIDDLPRLVRTYRIKQALIAIPSATAEQLRRIVELCQQAEVEVRTLPGVYELISGQVQVQRFRPVQLEDLLPRAPISTDIVPVSAMLHNQTVLITGAGGSIGAELCRQVALCNPRALVLLGHGENSIFTIQNELLRIYPKIPHYAVIADIRDAARIERIFATYRPQVVFHAAAHKHVPLMEYNPEEAVLNNVGGTLNLLRAAEAANCQHFVMISTDKAVNPTSVMGATKRVAEHLVQAVAQRTGRGFVAVRFGNVLGSRGSVVPFFQKQIEAGGPVTVTHPDIERYFMTIPEAVQLVLQAATLGSGGEVFVLDMGSPVKIVDLARDLIRLAGLQPDEDIPIVFTGLRPGEKLYEELFLDAETHIRTPHEKIFVSQNHISPLPQFYAQVDALLEAAHVGEHTTLMTRIRALVPECAPAFGTTIRNDD